MELDGDKWEIEDTLVFYVDNPRLNDLSLTITVEFENDVDVLETSYSESISVGSQSNETFSIELSTSDAEKVRSQSPSEKITIIVLLKRALLEELVRQRRLKRTSMSLAITNFFQKSPWLRPQLMQERG